MAFITFANDLDAAMAIVVKMKSYLGPSDFQTHQVYLQDNLWDL